MQKINSDALKEEIRSLWTLCFQDTPEFVDLYFRRRYTDKLNVSLNDGNRVVSALQIIPYEMNTWGWRYPMGYLSGVCTHPQARHQGWMRRLLSLTHHRLYEDGYIVSTLIPAEHWLFDCYGASGYASVFNYTWSYVRPEMPDPCICIIEYRSESRDVYAYFSRKMAERPCCVQHSEDDFQVILADLYLSKGNLWVARWDGIIVGLAFVVPTLNGCRITEMFADSSEVRNTLVSYACGYYHAEQAECLQPVSVGQKSCPLGMLRIIRLHEVLMHYATAHPEIDVCWVVKDSDIPENDGCYRICEGMCTQLDHIPVEASSMSISDVANVLWKEPSLFPYMSLMLN